MCCVIICCCVTICCDVVYTCSVVGVVGCVGECRVVECRVVVGVVEWNEGMSKHRSGLYNCELSVSCMQSV